MERFFCVLRPRKPTGLLRAWGMFPGRVFGSRELIVLLVAILATARYFSTGVGGAGGSLGSHYTVWSC